MQILSSIYYTDAAEKKKKTVFKAKKGYPILLTNSRVEVIQFYTGSIQLEKQKQQIKHSHPWNLESTMFVDIKCFTGFESLAFVLQHY